MEKTQSQLILRKLEIGFGIIIGLGITGLLILGAIFIMCIFRPL